MPPYFVPEPIAAPAPAVEIAAVGPAMLTVAATACDGVKLHPFSTRRSIEQAVMPRLTDGLAAVGRARRNFEIAGGGFVATGPDDAAVARMVEWVRGRVAFYGSAPRSLPGLAPPRLGGLRRQ